MASLTNFYESLPEARRRLDGTIVCYDGDPYRVMGVEDNPDNIFRLYLEPVGLPMGMLSQNQAIDYNPDRDNRSYMDALYESTNGPYGTLRKKINSPKFNRFRPFPLGMMNYSGSVYYLSRSPERRSHQGLTLPMIRQDLLTSGRLDVHPMGGRLSMYTPSFRFTVLGRYPGIRDCLTAMTDPTCLNDGAAFSRDFALIKGPVSALFLAYKDAIVGLLPNGDTSKLVLSNQFGYTREVCDSLSVFEDITTR